MSTLVHFPLLAMYAYAQVLSSLSPPLAPSSFAASFSPVTLLFLKSLIISVIYPLLAAGYKQQLLGPYGRFYFFNDRQTNQSINERWSESEAETRMYENMVGSAHGMCLPQLVGKRTAKRLKRGGRARAREIY